jgi:predicted negative regulator of RcsB-dependent stress response
MAAQRVSNERKKELRQLDPLQRNIFKAMDFARYYKKQLLYVSVAVVVVAIVFAGVLTSFKRSENTASDRVAKAMLQYSTLAEDPAAAYQAVKDDFQTVLTDYGNTDAGRLALVRFAGICMEAGQYDDAEKWFEKAYDVYGDQAGLGNFLLSSLGHVQLAKNNPDEAEPYFMQIETGESDLLKDEARFILAKIYEARQEASKSRKMYDLIAREHENSIYADLAQSMKEMDSVQQGG